MNDKKSTELSSEEKILREKSRQLLKKNKTPLYSPDDEGGVMAGPLNKESMKNQSEENNE